MKEQNGKLSRDEFLSFVKAVLKKKSLEENKPLYFEYKDYLKMVRKKNF